MASMNALNLERNIAKAEAEGNRLRETILTDKTKNSDTTSILRSEA